MNKVGATFLAWAIAPVAALVTTTVVELHDADFSTLSLQKLAPGFFYISLYAYIITSLVGLPTHLFLLNRRKTQVTNYALVGAMSMIVVTAGIAWAIGYQPARWTLEGLKVTAFFALNGLVVATVFGWIYHKLAQPV